MLTREQIQESTEADPQEMDLTIPLRGFSARDRNALPPTGRSGGNGGRPGRGGDDACEFVSVNLSAYQDGELDSDSLKLIVSHLSHCPHCSAAMDALQEIDETLEREWRDSAPLPSSSQFARSIASIMDALPDEPAATPAFAPKRVHARARWTRFATGVAGAFAFGGLLWSSYRLGYQEGQHSNVSRYPANGSAGSGNNAMPVSFFVPDARPLQSVRLSPASASHTPDPTAARSVETP
jgi:anti-sigma factor RsiW